MSQLQSLFRMSSTVLRFRSTSTLLSSHVNQSLHSGTFALTHIDHNNNSKDRDDHDMRVFSQSPHMMMMGGVRHFGAGAGPVPPKPARSEEVRGLDKITF